MVDCAIAVCAATTNKRATNNPEKTLIFFTVFYPPFFLSKKNAQPHQNVVHNWTSSSSEFLPHSFVRCDRFVTQPLDEVKIYFNSLFRLFANRGRTAHSGL